MLRSPQIFQLDCPSHRDPRCLPSPWPGGGPHSSPLCLRVTPRAALPLSFARNLTCLLLEEELLSPISPSPQRSPSLPVPFPTKLLSRAASYPATVPGVPLPLQSLFSFTPRARPLKSDNDLGVPSYPSWPCEDPAFPPQGLSRPESPHPGHPAHLHVHKTYLTWIKCCSLKLRHVPAVNSHCKAGTALAPAESLSTFPLCTWVWAMICMCIFHKPRQLRL